MKKFFAQVAFLFLFMANVSVIQASDVSRDFWSASIGFACSVPITQILDLEIQNYNKILAGLPFLLGGYWLNSAIVGATYDPTKLFLDEMIFHSSLLIGVAFLKAINNDLLRLYVM